LFAFEQAHPEFSLRLLEINPQLSKPEIEFCALLKLNLSTKEIARLKFIETRTVQNKKYRIRKRLNIPGSNDIYNWFGAI
jgi:DNA-binding CsgD family transcriptional regulator